MRLPKPPVAGVPCSDRTGRRLLRRDLYGYVRIATLSRYEAK